MYMKYNVLGRTGLKVSEIGYGAEHLEGKSFKEVDQVVNRAIDGGINIIDVFMPQAEVRTNIGKAIGHRRKDVILQGHIGAALQADGQYLRTRDVDTSSTYVKDFLTRFNTDYIDLGMIHYVDTEEDFDLSFNSPFIDYVQKLKRDGVIRYIGASTHDAATGIKMVETGIVDMLLFSINPAFDLSPSSFDLGQMFEGKKLDKLEIEPTRQAFYNLCAAKNVGITVMKTLAAGRLLKEETSSLGYALSVPQCVSYALDRPAVASVLLGAETVEEVDEALLYEKSTKEERDYAAVMELGMPLLGAKCMYCNHCLPCPVNIDIAAVTKFLDMVEVSDNELVRDHYNTLSSHASDCIECGICETNCPFGIEIIENMRKAALVFGQ